MNCADHAGKLQGVGEAGCACRAVQDIVAQHSVYAGYVGGCIRHCRYFTLIERLSGTVDLQLQTARLHAAHGTSMNCKSTLCPNHLEVRRSLGRAATCYFYSYGNARGKLRLKKHVVAGGSRLRLGILADSYLSVLRCGQC